MNRWFSDRSKTLFACVHVPEFPAQALLRLRPALHGQPVAVLEGSPPHEHVCAGNALARRGSLRNGMTRVEAEAFAGITVLQRSRDEEEAARTALLGCIGNFVPMLETCHTHGTAECMFDVEAVTPLYSEPRVFANALQRALLNRGFDASIAICANFHAARALAQGTPGITIAAPGEEQRALAPVLLHVLGSNVLELTQEQAHTLSLWGISTLGGLAALPRKELSVRMGRGGKRLRELARGEHPHIFAPLPVPRELREEFTLAVPVRMLEALLFVLSPMLDQLILKARERALAIATIRVTFTFATGVRGGETQDDYADETANATNIDIRAHADRSLDAVHPDSVDLNAIHLVVSKEDAARNRIPVSIPMSHRVLPLKASSSARICQYTIRPALPTQSKRLLLKLLQLELTAHPPTAPVLAVVLEAAAAKANAAQRSLFAPLLC